MKFQSFLRAKEELGGWGEMMVTALGPRLLTVATVSAQRDLASATWSQICVAKMSREEHRVSQSWVPLVFGGDGGHLESRHGARIATISKPSRVLSPKLLGSFNPEQSSNSHQSVTLLACRSRSAFAVSNSWWAQAARASHEKPRVGHETNFERCPPPQSSAASGSCLSGVDQNRLRAFEKTLEFKPGHGC